MDLAGQGNAGAGTFTNSSAVGGTCPAAAPIPLGPDSGTILLARFYRCGLRSSDGPEKAGRKRSLDSSRRVTDRAGIAYGQPGNASGLSEKAQMLEIFYKYKVSDNISVTPALLYITNNQAFQNASDNWGGVIQTKFTF